MEKEARRAERRRVQRKRMARLIRCRLGYWHWWVPPSICLPQFMSRPPSSSSPWTTASGTPPRVDDHNRNRITSLFNFNRPWIKTLKRSNTVNKLYKKYLQTYKPK
ncbi:unnamed protein product [Sphenostylis stenocarpa]|uniref:Uncharacterized protein n=1 Tax=Sphenostylis stenocarpa TaxID=92480 RepID=A0AA86W178_9FABA|nr:unnamed protein product [Sphenostylis stenocarpa]